MHSRNSCKTLKCPRCNWHYKYQETLEIHMKEKHPENELICGFCQRGEVHPKLTRGETYACGYKPYRCEVCNYASSTKGNLSIHMSSDKHMTNIQQYEAAAAVAGKLQPPASTQHQQSQPVTTTTTNSSLNGNPTTPTNSTEADMTAVMAQLQQHSELHQDASNSSLGDPNQPTGADGDQQQQQQTTLANIIAIQSQAMMAMAAAQGGDSTNVANSASNSPVSSRNQSPSVQQVSQSGEQSASSLFQSLQQQQLASSLSNALALAAASSSSASSSPATLSTGANQASSALQAGNSSAAAVAAALQQQLEQPAGNSQPAGGQSAAAAVAAAILLAQQNPNALEDYINSQEMAKDSYDDPMRKYKCHRCKVAFTRQSYLTAHNKTLFHRKGEKLAYPMEKYLDPNRPFKCDICKESFTQKSILLVHNNSVSHLNKLRQNKKAAGLEQQLQLQQQQQQQQQHQHQHQHQQQHQPQQQQHQHQLQLPSATSAPSPTSMSSQQQSSPSSQQVHSMSQQQPASQQQSALAALANDPMAALMMGGGNPMAALMAQGAGISHPMMPFMMSPHLMAAAALAAAQTQRMLDPMGAASQGLFGQASSPAVSSPGGNPFAEFQSQQQQLMQQAASQLAAAAAASSQPSSSSAYSQLGNLLSQSELLQQSMASSMAATSVVSAGGSLAGSSLNAAKSNSSAVTDANLVSSTLDSLHQSRQQQQQQQSAGAKLHSNGLESAQAAAAAAAAALSVQQQKRARTRISEEQLRILRQYFDINNSPTEDQLQEMSVKSELPLKVIKHWFRNTLFKERQKNKDSPYNFNNPPMLALNLEEYERTGEAKVTPISDLMSAGQVFGGSLQQQAILGSALQAAAEGSLAETAGELLGASPGGLVGEPAEAESVEAGAAAVVRAVVSAVADESAKPTPSGAAGKRSAPAHPASFKRIKLEPAEAHELQLEPDERAGDFERQFVERVKLEMSRLESSNQQQQQLAGNDSNNNTDQNRCDSGDSQPDSGDSDNELAGPERAARGLRRAQRLHKARKLSPVSDENAGIGPSSTWSPLQLQQQLFDQTWATVNNHLSNQGLSSKTSDSSSHSINSSTNSKSKRANRTRFSDRQVKVLQEFFETNAYPKDDDLECLSKQLGLSPRVIVVWFQNARQKARKVYENRPTSASMSEPDEEQAEQLVQPAQGSLTGGQHQAGRRRAAPMSPASQGDAESSLGGPQSPSGSMGDFGLLQGSSLALRQQRRQQQHLNELFLAGNLDNESNRGDDDELDGSNNRRHRATDDMNDDEAHNEEEDDDEFMSAAQMMRHQQQQQQQQQAQRQRHHQNQHQDQPHHQQHQHQQHQQQQHSQQMAAAAAAGLFGGDASNLLSLIANHQAASVGGNLLGSDLHQRSMMDALSSAMRGAVGQGANGQVSHPLGPNGAAPNLGLNDSSNTSLGAASNVSERNNSASSAASQRDKRLRTQISPEQLEYLYQKYQVESNPSRKTLESIAQDVGLSKRVVQVWFQNTRARERRGQLRNSHVVAQQQRNQQQQQQAAGATGPTNSAAGKQNGAIPGAQNLGQQNGAAGNNLSSPLAGANNPSELKDENGNSQAATAAAVAAAAAQLAGLSGPNAAAMAALMRGQLAGLEGTPGFAPLDLSGSKALFAGLNQLGAFGVAGLNFEPQQQR